MTSPRFQTNMNALNIWHSITVRGLKQLDVDLSARQSAIMFSIYLTPGPHTVKSLSEQLGISKPAICRALDTLSQYDLVKRKTDEQDRRKVTVQRTLKGTVYLSEFAELIIDASKQLGGAAPSASAETPHAA